MEKTNKSLIITTLAIFFVVAFVSPTALFAATTPSLGAAANYGVLGSTYTNTAAGTTINGDLGYINGPATAPTVNGTTFINSGTYSQAGTDQGTALSNLNSQSCTSLGAIVTLSGTYTPGCYSSTGAMDIALSTTITLNGAGTYIFRPNGAFTTGANAIISLTGGASASDVFWTPTAAVTLGANNTFKGTVIAPSGITIGSTIGWIGRALAFGGTVSTDVDTITVPTNLRVIKLVVNTGGGTAVASNFNVHVKLSGTDVSGSPAVGTSVPGTSYPLSAGTYVVSEDPVAGYGVTFSGDCNSSGSVTLSAGDDKTCTIINTFIIGSGGGGSTFSPLPLINVTKIPSPLNLPGGAGVVTYTYVATNIGPVAMSNVWVKDNKCNANNFLNLISGDNNNNSMLDLNEAWIYSCTKTVSQTETNTATARGFYNGWDTYDTANATVVVGASVVPPLIHIIKIPNVFVLPAGGGPVTYAYAVTNPGTAPLSNVSVIDDKCTGLPGRVVGHPGDLNKNNLLESNETWSFTCQTTITNTTTNTATAEGHANGLIALDYSSATVVVGTPTLPNTGVAPNEKNTPWNIILLSGMFVISILFYITRKKHTV